MALIGLSIWLLFGGDASIDELSRITPYSRSELIFLKEQGFLDVLDLENLTGSTEEIISVLKSSTLIEQELSSPDESFEVLATKLDESTYQLAFKLENKSNQSKEFYLIPISESSQTEFKEIKGRISGAITEVYNTPLAELYDVEEHKLELKPELAQAYNDIDNNNYLAKPIKITLDANTVLIAKSQWQIRLTETRVSDSLEPVYLLVYGSAGGAKDELDKDKIFEELDKVEKVKEDHFKIKYDKYSEVELGNLETDDFEPTAKLKKWGDETYIKVSYPTTKKIKPKQEDKKLKWKDDKVEVHFYPLEPIEFEENGHIVKQLQEGGFLSKVVKGPIKCRCYFHHDRSSLDLSKHLENGVCRRITICYLSRSKPGPIGGLYWLCKLTVSNTYYINEENSLQQSIDPNRLALPAPLWIGIITWKDSL